MRKGEVKLVYIRAGNEEEVYLNGSEQNITEIFDTVKKLFDLGCKVVSAESKDFSLLFDSSAQGSKAIMGRFKQGYQVLK